jgi:hypothetical protein
MIGRFRREIQQLSQASQTITAVYSFDSNGDRQVIRELETEAMGPLTPVGFPATSELVFLEDIEVPTVVPDTASLLDAVTSLLVRTTVVGNGNTVVVSGELGDGTRVGPIVLPSPAVTPTPPVDPLEAARRAAQALTVLQAVDEKRTAEASARQAAADLAAAIAREALLQAEIERLRRELEEREPLPDTVATAAVDAVAAVANGKGKVR